MSAEGLRRALGTLIPNVYAGIIALSAALASLFLIYLGWVWVFEASDPITEDTVVEVRPADAYVHRDGDAPSYFGLTRRLCADRTATAEVIRSWTEYMRQPAGPDGAIPERPMGEPVVVSSTQTTTVRKGCHRYSVDGPVPRSLPPGTYTYEAELRFRVPPFPDAMHRLSEVNVSIGGGVWLQPDPPRPPAPPPPP